jgi:hypothetical protein
MSSMADRPIIFSALMVRALLAGRKTQTRRLATSPLHRVEIGDRLYVRECWAPIDACTHNDPGTQACVDRGFYRADQGTIEGEISRWRPAIHMPRWASRLTLIVERVQIEALQGITEADADAEGVVWDSADGFDVWYVPGADLPHTSTAAECFAGLWGSLHHAVGERWHDNPIVVALTFRVERGNIDRLTQ